ncbi:MAG: aminodeoxychorismate lyase [Steroidobacteraceae bacterium]
MTRAWIDGKPSSEGLLADRALHYGDGLFETISVRNSRARFLDLHAARLDDGCRRLGIVCDAGASLASSVALLGAEARDGTLKVIVSRGDARVRGYAPRGDEQSRVFSYWYPGAVAAPTQDLEVALLTHRWGENAQLAGMKHLNRLEQVLARRELAASGAGEGLVLSSNGLLSSGTQCNVFLWFGDSLVTPRVDRCGIAGVMRAVVLREAARLGLPVQVADLPVSALAQASALFFTNARIGLQFATRLEGLRFERPDALLRLAAAVEALDG